MDSVARDIRYAIRQLRGAPGVTAIVVATLAIGIGANTAIFSVVDGVLLRPLPYRSPETLGYITRDLHGGSDVDPFISGPDGVELADQVDGIESIAFLAETVIGPMTGASAPAHVRFSRVSWNLFDLLGVVRALGRTTVPEDGLVSADTLNPPPSSAVISHGLWSRAFGSDPDVLGRKVQIWGRTHEIVGVLPRDFELWSPPELNVGQDMDVWAAWRIPYDYEDPIRSGSAWRPGPYGHWTRITADPGDN